MFADVRIKGYRVPGTKCSPGIQENMGTWLDPGWIFSSGRGNSCHTMWLEVNALPFGANKTRALLASLASPYIMENCFFLSITTGCSLRY